MAAKHVILLLFNMKMTKINKTEVVLFRAYLSSVNTSSLREIYTILKLDIFAQFY